MDIVIKRENLTLLLPEILELNDHVAQRKEPHFKITEEMKKRDCKEGDAKKNMLNLAILNDCCGLVQTVPNMSMRFWGVMMPCRTGG